MLVLADDPGYSDLGCFSGEINTPNLDAVGRAAEWQRWAERVAVIRFEVTLNLYRERGLTVEEAAG